MVDIRGFFPRAIDRNERSPPESTRFLTPKPVIDTKGPWLCDDEPSLTDSTRAALSSSLATTAGVLGDSGFPAEFDSVMVFV